MKRSIVGLAALMVLIGPVSGQAALILDRSPATIGVSGSDLDYMNQSTGEDPFIQYWGERVTFTLEAQLGGMDVYSHPPPGRDIVVGDSATIKIWSDSAGSPGALLYDFTETVSVIDSEGATSGFERKHVDFSTPISLSGGGVYWIGMSGTEKDMGQLRLSTYPYDDGRMALFNFLGFDAVRAGGDMAFRLHGTVIPEPTTLVALSGLLGMGLIAHFWRRRRKGA